MLTYKDAYHNETPEGPSLQTCISRARSVAAHGACKCGKHKHPGELKRGAVPCRRCLGTIEK